MAVEVKMPQLGESVHEGTIGKWLKAEGDEVQKYEPLLEVITDKVDTEVTAVEGGTVLKILVPEGETVSVGTVLAVIGEAGEEVAAQDGAGAAEATGGRPAVASGVPADGDAPARADDGPSRVSPVAARVAADLGVDVAGVSGTGRGGQVTRQDVERHAAGGDGQASGATDTAPPEPADQAGGVKGSELGFISPRVARLAAEHGVNLRQVEGTGRDGRVTARDVEEFVAAGGARAAEPSSPLARAGDGVTPGTLIPLTPIRQAIADHMVRSKQTSPHVTTVHEADMAAVMTAYRSLRGDYEAKGVRLTITAFIVKAAAEALAAHPLVNSRWTDAGIQTEKAINIGLAVAAPQGLIVPVIKNADEKSLAGLAREINDLAERARNKALNPDDVKGGTFTLTNYGTLGSLFGTPVINQPQAAILGAGAIKKRPVVIEGPDGDSLGIRPMILLALTFDHRILDGAAADPFMQTMVERLEHFTT